jgi:hypothetical protein
MKKAVPRRPLPAHYAPNRAPWRLLALCLLLVASLLGAAPLHAALGGTLTGKVVMKTPGASLPAAPLTVTLLFFNGGFFRISDEAIDFKTTTTAPDGSFTFAGLDTEPTSAYRVVVSYKGVQYEPAERDVTDASGATAKSRAVRFENNATTAATDVPIYEPVVADAATTFAVTSHQIIINEIRPQFYSVLEVLQIANPGDRTLVGALAPDGSATQGVPLLFNAPPSALTITTNRTDLLGNADLTAQKLTLRAPIVPGSNDVTALYNLQGDPASGVTFTRTLDYATAKVQVLVSDTRQAMFSRTLKDGGPIQAPQAATAFRQFSLDNAQAGQAFDLTIGPSPAARTQPAATAQPNFFQRLRDRAGVPVLLGLAGVCLVLLVLVLRLPVRPKGAPGAREGGTPTKTVPTVERRVAGAETSGTPGRKPRAGRSPDVEVDEAEAEIEAANAEKGDEPGT